MRTILALTVLASCFGCSTVSTLIVANPGNVVPVSIFTGGDDGLTQRLAAAIEIEFFCSSQFARASGLSDNPLRVTIPTNVEWDKIGGSTRVKYQLRLERRGRKIVYNRGICLEREIQVCARQVVNAAARSIRR